MKRTKLVLDTNILIYGINEESRYFEEINRVMENPRYQFFVTCKQISEFICVLSKLGRYDAIENELPLILNKFKVIFPNKRSIRIFQDLINKYKPVGNIVFDIEIVSIMLSKNIKNLYSINVRDFNHIEEIQLIENLAS
jgi:predicted nucleic acid-binding protein